MKHGEKKNREIVTEKTVHETTVTSITYSQCYRWCAHCQQWVLCKGII